MRIIGTIPNPTFRIVVYEVEKHIYVEVEAGPMKQGYKWPKSSVPGLTEAQRLMDKDFLDKIHVRFDEMYGDMKRLLEKDKG